MKSIQQMNEEFQAILMNLPEGVVLINKDNKNVTLGNLEFRRLFSVPKLATNEGIAVKLNDPILYKFNNGPNVID